MKKLIGYKSRLLTGIGFLFAILSISSSCTKPDDDKYGLRSGPGAKGGYDGPGTNEVWIQSIASSPSSIKVAAGNTITLTS